MSETANSGSRAPGIRLLEVIRVELAATGVHYTMSATSADPLIR